MKSRIPNALVAATALGVFLALACEDLGSESGRPGTQLRDSAGIRIIENASPPEGSRLLWRIGPEPTLTIGEVDGEEPYLLYGAGDATRLSDGRIVVVNGGTQELRAFDASGTHLATWGGTGEGPGEFQYLESVGRWPGDSIFAWTAPRLGISVFAPDGSFGRTFNMDGNGPQWFYFTPISVNGDGSVLAVFRPEADTMVVELRDDEGRTIANFGTHTNAEPHRIVEGERRLLFWKIFGREPVYDTWGDLVVIGSTDRYELRAFRADGTLDRIVRRAHLPRAPTPDDVAAHIHEQLGRMSPGMPDAYRRALPRVPVAEHFPAFASIMTDAVDHLWVEEYEFPGEERPGRLWTVFDPEGYALGFVETPEVVWIHEIGEDYILTWERDEMGVESVQLWPLDRGGG